MMKRPEAKADLTGHKTSKILGVGVSGTNKERLLREITTRINNSALVKPFFVITAYSENIMETERDKDLESAFSLADLIVADGVSVLAAGDYLKARTGEGWGDFWRGFEIGGKILRGEYAGKRILGVKLTEELLSLAGERKWRIFLLGGMDDEAEKLARKFGKTINYYEPPMGMKIDDRQQTKIILEKVSSTRPDILLVGLGRFKQEKWIAKNLEKLKTKVVMGVGSSFDELTGAGAWGSKTPEWVDRMGLKWLWRGLRDPRHLKRAWNAFPVFAWKVFRSR